MNLSVVLSTVMIVYSRIHGVEHISAGEKRTEKLLSELPAHLELLMVL